MSKEFKIDLVTADDLLLYCSYVCGYSAGEEALFILRSKNVTPSARRYVLKVKTEELI